MKWVTREARRAEGECLLGTGEREHDAGARVSTDEP